MRRQVNRRPGHLLAGLLGASLCAVGCADNDQSLVITTLFQPLDDCSAPVSSGKVLGRGVFDVGLAALVGQGYVLAPRMVNNLPSTAALNAAGPGTLPATEMNNVFGTGFDVDVVPDPNQPITSVLSPGVPGVTSYSIPIFTGQLNAAGGAATVPIEVINANAATQLLNSQKIRPGVSAATEAYQTLTIRVRARGTHSGLNVFSNTVVYPLSVCAFCLPLRPGFTGESGYNPANGLYDCPEPLTLDASTVVNPVCSPAQDKASTCCVRDRTVLCGKNIPTKPKA